MQRTNNITITRNKYGFRSIVLNGTYKISADLAKVASGRDRWIAEIQLPCVDCGESHAARDMEMHGQYCPSCWERMDEEEGLI